MRTKWLAEIYYNYRWRYDTLYTLCIYVIDVDTKLFERFNASHSFILTACLFYFRCHGYLHAALVVQGD